MLYQLSYASATEVMGSSQSVEALERETGIEPATNSLEGCDSTIELLPLFSKTILRNRLRGVNWTRRGSGKHMHVKMFQ